MIKRIIWHWTAGAVGIHPIEKDSYNYVIHHDATIVHGDWPPEAQFPPLKPGKYAAHTWNTNSYAIGVAVDGMHGAVERPFSGGTAPINMKQIDTLVSLTADLCLKWDVPVSRETTLSHAEVQGNLGIKQRPKWDIIWLPDMPKPGPAVEVGDRLRRMVQMELDKHALARVRPAPRPVMPVPVDYVRPPTPPAPVVRRDNGTAPRLDHVMPGSLWWQRIREALRR